MHERGRRELGKAGEAAIEYSRGDGEEDPEYDGQEGSESELEGDLEGGDDDAPRPAREWRELPARVAVLRGSSLVTTKEDMRPFLRRGGRVRINQVGGIARVYGGRKKSSCFSVFAFALAIRL